MAQTDKTMQNCFICHSSILQRTTTRYNCGYDFGSCSCKSSCRLHGNCCKDYYGKEIKCSQDFKFLEVKNVAYRIISLFSFFFYFYHPNHPILHPFLPLSRLLLWFSDVHTSDKYFFYHFRALRIPLIFCFIF